MAALKAGEHDGVIAFGGGSALDAGKAIALMVGQTRPIWDFEDREDWWTRVDEAGMVPVVAVPTTSGTGSETGRASAITDTRGDHVKRIIFHPAMMPGRVILDPELTVGLPAPLTAAVGMDALSHCLEAFSSPVFHPLAQGIALEGMRLVREALPDAVADGADLAARARMQVAASMGSTAFQKGLGAMHSLSHPCGAVLDTHHGLTNAVVMPYVLDFNRPAIEDRMAAVARYLDLPESLLRRRRSTGFSISASGSGSRTRSRTSASTSRTRAASPRWRRRTPRRRPTRSPSTPRTSRPSTFAPSTGRSCKLSAR